MTSGSAGSPGERSLLCFRKEAEKAFAFLVRDYGFHLVDAGETLLRYESSGGVFVNVYHGRSSYELKFELGRVSATGAEERFYPTDLADIAGTDEESFFQASTAERVRTYLPRLARLLIEHGGDALKGDLFAFKRLRDLQVSKSDALARSWDLADARARANRAWRDKDYGCVIEAYEPVKEHLTPSERKKLEYAQSRRGRNP